MEASSTYCELSQINVVIEEEEEEEVFDFLPSTSVLIRSCFVVLATSINLVWEHIIPAGLVNLKTIKIQNFFSSILR